MQYQILDENGGVINTIEADEAYMQFTYAPGYYRAVEVPDTPAGVRHITKRAFWGRFPVEKEIVMRAVRIGSPAGALMLVGMLDMLNSRVDSSPYVNLDEPATIAGIGWLASAQCPANVTIDGVSMPMRLTEAEHDAILLADIGAHEVYRP